MEIFFIWKYIKLRNYYTYQGMTITTMENARDTNFLTKTFINC